MQHSIVIDDGMLVYREPIRGSTSYTWLLIVPKALFNIVFVAFHSNLIGGRFNSYYTLHCLHLQYFRPEMYSYIKKIYRTFLVGHEKPSKNVISQTVY
jgi:hypothetical protein